MVVAAEKQIGAVVFFGPPAAGKGTQARQMAKRLGIPHISTGDMIRAEVAAGTTLGQEARAIMEKGELIPDEIVNRMVRERLKQPDCRRGFVLDGYPRTRGQAQALENMLQGNDEPMTVFNIQLPAEDAVRRITGRRTCPKCGTIYNLYGHPPRDPGRCDLDQTPLVMRTDDREEVIRGRLECYERDTRPVVDYFRQQGQAIHEIDGSLPAEAISDRLCRILSPA
ncbi:MAG: adenylate kinase [Acidobacteria bacterium]|nr:adenylate kinase [Acidobacteriota bacterium]